MDEELKKWWDQYLEHWKNYPGHKPVDIIPYDPRQSPWYIPDGEQSPQKYPWTWPQDTLREKPKCSKCGLVLDNLMLYVCPQDNCPIFPKATC